MAIKYLSGKRLQGTSAERDSHMKSSPPQTAWKELGRTTLGSAGSTIDVNGNTWNLQVGAEISSNRFKLTSPSSPPYAQIAKELDSTVDGDFCLRFRIKWHSGDSYAYFGLTDEEPSSTTDTTMDSCMAGFYFTAGSNRGMRAHAAAASSYAVDPIASAGVAQTGVANTDYYIELSRDVSAETLTLKKYTASDYTGTPETHTQTSTPSGINGLKYLKAVYSHDGATGGASAHVLFDQIKLYKDTTTATGTVFYEELLSGLTAKPYMMVLTHALQSGVIIPSYQFNGDTGNNYIIRTSLNGASDSVGNAAGKIQWSNAGTDDDNFSVGDIMNISNQEKLVVVPSVKSDTGAGNAPSREECIGKWANTSDSITSVNVNNSQSGDFAAGSEVVVLGYDPDDTEGTSVWEELASVELGSSNAEISSGTITAKKYLWVQIDQKGVSNNVGNISVRFNNDTGTNYASRYSVNGGSDNTSQTSKTSIYMHDDAGDDTKGSLHNIFIINKADKEKLIISETIQNTATGAGTAPARSEEVGKWVNTSDQITEIDIFGLGGGSFDTGSSIKVWGFD